MTTKSTATASKKATAKTKAAYAVKSDGVYMLRGKSYVKITDPNEIEKAKQSVAKSLGLDVPKRSEPNNTGHQPEKEDEERFNGPIKEMPLMEILESIFGKGNVIRETQSQSDANFAEILKEINRPRSVTESQKEPSMSAAMCDLPPTRKSTSLDTILVNMEHNNIMTIQAMNRIEKVLDKVCPLDKDEPGLERDTPINTIHKLQYENQTHSFINDRLERIAAHMEEVL